MEPSLKTSILRNESSSISQIFNFESPPTSASSISTISLGTEIPDFMIWVKEEPFIFGILSPNPCVKLGVNVLRKIAEYCRDKDGYYPTMNLVQWGHISKHKLILPIDLSWSLLRLFDIISKNLDPSEDNSKWDLRCEEIRTCASDDYEEITVDTLKFLVFLYTQHFIRLHKKYLSRPLSSDDPWPSNLIVTLGSPSACRAKSPQRHGTNGILGSPAGSSASLKKKVIPEQTQAEFLISNLHDIIDYLMLAIKNRPKEEGRITLEIVRALSFVLGAASVNPHDREFKSLEECLIVLPEVAEAVEFDLGKGTLDKVKFIKWVRANLKLNPWGPSSATIAQQCVESLMGIWEKTKAYEGNRIYWNTQLCPKAWYLISSVNNQVLYLDTIQPLSSLKIHRCNNSYIYIPGVFTSIVIEKCRNSTIFLGPVGKVVKFVECANILITSVGRLFILCNIYKSTFHILTPCQPIICGNQNRRLTLAPYNSFYPKLEEHMGMVGLGVEIQKWNKPLELGSNGVPLGKGQTPNYSIMRPEKFGNLVFPFEMKGATTKNPIELPPNYAKVLQQIKSKTQMFKNDVKAMNYTEEQTYQLNFILKARFRKWLKEKGYMKELKGLRSIQESLKAGSSIPILEGTNRKKSLSNSNKEDKAAEKRGQGQRGGGCGGDLYTGGSSSKIKPSNASSISLVSTIGSASTGSSIGGGAGPGVVSESDCDDVFVYQGDDFEQLDSVFFSEGEDTGRFLDSFELGDGDDDGDEGGGGGSPWWCGGSGIDDSAFDDGLNWSAI